MLDPIGWNTISPFLYSLWIPALQCWLSLDCVYRRGLCDLSVVVSAESVEDMTGGERDMS